MAGASFEILGIDKLLPKLTPALYREAVKELLTDGALLGERTAKQGAFSFHDTGALSRAITREVTPTYGRVFVARQGAVAQYAEVMELGRRAGAKPPPQQALVGWMSRHGMDPKLAFVLARAIGRRGIKGRFYFKAAYDAVQRALPGLATKASAAVQARWNA